MLAPVLQALSADPGDNRTQAELASAFHATERTLDRRCQRDLGMGLSEWRQRLRVVKALPRLQAGDKIEAIALDLGYASASAFIAMFRRLTNVTPDEFRKGAPSPQQVVANAASARPQRPASATARHRNGDGRPQKTGPGA